MFDLDEKIQKICMQINVRNELWHDDGYKESVQRSAIRSLAEELIKSGLVKEEVTQSYIEGNLDIRQTLWVADIDYLSSLLSDNANLKGQNKIMKSILYCMTEDNEEM